MDLNGVAERIIGAAIAAHRALGSGLLESTCEPGLAHEAEVLAASALDLSDHQAPR
jgi:hypothetical protein